MAVTQKSRWDDIGTEIPVGLAKYEASKQPIAEYDNWINYNLAKDIENIIANVIDKDGSVAMTGNLDMNGHNIDSVSQYYLKNNGVNMLKFLGNMFAQVHFYPQTTNSLLLGGVGLKWSDIYGVNAHFDNHNLIAADIPDLAASKITSGTLALARIPATLTGKDADTVDGIQGAEILKKDGSVEMTQALKTVAIDRSSDALFVTYRGGSVAAACYDQYGKDNPDHAGFHYWYATNAMKDGVEEAMRIAGVTDTPKLELKHGLKTNWIEERTTDAGVKVGGFKLSAATIRRLGNNQAMYLMPGEGDYNPSITLYGKAVGGGLDGDINIVVPNTAKTDSMIAIEIRSEDSPKPIFNYGLKTNWIEEKTAGNGVTIDGCLIKDGYPHIPNHTPSSASDTGTEGQVCYDANYIYMCIATNTWKRVAISTW